MDAERKLKPLFERILKLCRNYQVFKNAPSLFVAYAWNIDDTHAPAGSDIVQEYLNWLTDVGYPIYSDSTTPREVQVTDGQLRLLPVTVYADAVDRVVLCGSQLLGEYMENTLFEEFQQDMFEKYQAARQARGIESIPQIIRQVQSEHQPKLDATDNIISNFHHVLTELALLNIRNRVGQRGTIIPLLLNGRHDKCFPSYIIDGNDSLRTEIGPDGSKYSCFLEILEKLVVHTDLIPGPGNLIKSFKKIYDDAVSALRNEASIPIDLQTCLDQVSKASLEWTKEQQTSSNGIDVKTVRKALSNYHDKIMILENISGTTLSIDEYSIELREASGPDTSLSGAQSSPNNGSIPIRSLFNTNMMADDSSPQPRRIFIEGQPGVGKSTLCKQIFHEFGPKGVSGDKFFWVLWIPLGRLAYEKNFTDFLSTEYFHGVSRGADISEKLHRQVFGQDKANTLLILDGWDETSRWDKRKLDILKELAQFENVIITSRPTMQHISYRMPAGIDLKLHATGFNSETIKSYITNPAVIPSQPMSRDILSYVESKPVVLGLVKTPIHLEILCFSWNDLKKRPRSNENPTITMLYQTIVYSLWRRDLPSLEKRDPRDNYSKLTPDIINAVRNPKHLERFVEVETTFLEDMASELVEKAAKSFGDKEIETFIEKVGEKIPLSFERNLNNLSFLKAYDSGRERVYEFHHLTFLEYFAACKLAKDQELLKDHLRNRKYDPSFDRIWVLVSGILQDYSTHEQIFRFLKEIGNDDASDLLGPTRQLLLIRCSNEVFWPKYDHQSITKNEMKTIRKIYETDLVHWLQFEYSFTARTHTICAEELPQTILDTILVKLPPETKQYILLDLHRRIPFKQLTSILKSLLDKGEGLNIVRQALEHHLPQSEEMLQEYFQKLFSDNPCLTAQESDLCLLRGRECLLKQSLTKTLTRLFSNENCFQVKLKAYCMLCESTLEVDDWQELETCLNNPDISSAAWASLVLRNHPMRNSDTISEVGDDFQSKIDAQNVISTNETNVHQLRSDDKSIVLVALLGLAIQQRSLNDDTASAVVEKLDDEDGTIVVAAIWASLYDPKGYDRVGIKRLIKLYINRDGEVKDIVYTIMRSWQTLWCKDLAYHLRLFTEPKNREMRDETMDEMRDAVLNILAERGDTIHVNKERVRKAAREIMDVGQLNLLGLMEFALKSLSYKATWPNDLLKGMMEVLQQETLILPVLEFLKKQSSIPHNLVEEYILPLLSREDCQIILAALDVIQLCGPVADNTRLVSGIVEVLKLNKESLDIVTTAFQILYDQPELDDEHLKEILKALREYPQFGAEMLKKHHNLDLNGPPESWVPIIYRPLLVLSFQQECSWILNESGGTLTILRDHIRFNSTGLNNSVRTERNSISCPVSKEILWKDPKVIYNSDSRGYLIGVKEDSLRWEMSPF